MSCQGNSKDKGDNRETVKLHQHLYRENYIYFFQNTMHCNMTKEETQNCKIRCLIQESKLSCISYILKVTVKNDLYCPAFFFYCPIFPIFLYCLSQIFYIFLFFNHMFFYFSHLFVFTIASLILFMLIFVSRAIAKSYTFLTLHPIKNDSKGLPWAQELQRHNSDPMYSV